VKSKTLPSFWERYQALPDEAKRARENPINSGAIHRSIHPYISNALNKKNVFGPFVSREAIEHWVF
jgi:hypothetical protein